MISPTSQDEDMRQNVGKHKNRSSYLFLSTPKPTNVTTLKRMKTILWCCGWLVCILAITTFPLTATTTTQSRRHKMEYHYESNSSSSFLRPTKTSKVEDQYTKPIVILHLGPKKVRSECWSSRESDILDWLTMWSFHFVTSDRLQPQRFKDL